MKYQFFAKLRNATALFFLCLVAIPAQAQPQHAIAMYGDPALPPDFVSLPYANANAPQGGRIIFGESGSFDSLNPFILKGRAPWGQTALTTETLLGRSFDEPFTLYGLLAETVETDAARSFVEFTLRDTARFSDGSPVTVDDVLWSFETLGTIGHPRYLNSWTKVAKAEITGPQSVKITFNTTDRELPLIMGLRPILQKAQWQGKDFTASTLEAPIGSGPYIIGKSETGRFISFVKNPDWWGRDLPFNKGRHNLGEVRYDYFGDSGVMFEAFKAGELTSYRETNAAKWDQQYSFPAMTAGDVVKSEIPHSRPSGMDGFVMNTRRAQFIDWRVREALISAFNFEQINTTITGGAAPRIQSYFHNSVLAMASGTPATGAELALLQPFADGLLPGVIDGYALPIADNATNRKNIRAAKGLLEQAGWAPDAAGVLRDAAGTPFAFDILLTNGNAEVTTIANMYIEALKPLGITATLTSIDSAQMTERTNAYDFDMTHMIRSMSLSPGNEQNLYWGAAGVTDPGSRNWMGMNVPAAQAMIDAMLNAQTEGDFVAATKALDRVLTAGRYVVPFWYSKYSRLAHAKQLQFPTTLPIYGDWPGFQPDVWWYQPD
ncbi:peptide/nickel transport system substrate-binding protein [Pseudorhodobacter antarcticus]|uniref:Peptide/nickel transport system substrate-binding protein n=1 Tax=Pseudorhodobacter antarcticus TaxID=1077947 RepID=A0A1H8J5V3_9RHOB|nr:extracellular solute-binding protein [Pseudorhodobacter antarcticus]SEN75676.1 peptide/nickel transport system substrate-binding protein [Pseudorhodobacter antarcticus]